MGESGVAVVGCDVTALPAAYSSSAAQPDCGLETIFSWAALRFLPLPKYTHLWLALTGRLEVMIPAGEAFSASGLATCC